MKLSFNEEKVALAIRIEAHLKYSSLKLEDILLAFLEKEKPASILDVGCGSGNYSPLFARRTSLYVGSDKSDSLLNSAQVKCEKEGLKNALFLKWDMDQPFPYAPNSFDFVFFGYSVYYAEDAAALIQNIERVLKGPGYLCLVGPVEGNAQELDLICSSLWEHKSTEQKEVRSRRLETEFIPILKQRFSTVETQQRDFSLRFPSVEEYAKYFTATPQFIELSEKLGTVTSDQIHQSISQLKSLTLSKKSIFIWATGSRR